MSLVTNLSKVIEAEEYLSERFNPKPLLVTDNVKIISGYFHAGQFIPVHSPQIDLVMLIIKGEGTVIAEDIKEDVKEGSLIIVPRGEKRGILAKTKMVILHVVTPLPTAEDHKEVMEGLKKGSFD